MCQLAIHASMQTHAKWTLSQGSDTHSGQPNCILVCKICISICHIGVTLKNFTIPYIQFALGGGEANDKMTLIYTILSV